MDTDFKFVVSEFESKILIDLENIAFLVKPDFYHFFHTFLCMTQDSLDILKIGSIHIQEHLKTYQNRYSFYLEIIFIRYEIDSSEID